MKACKTRLDFNPTLGLQIGSGQIEIRTKEFELNGLVRFLNFDLVLG